MCCSILLWRTFLIFSCGRRVILVLFLSYEFSLIVKWANALLLGVPLWSCMCELLIQLIVKTCSSFPLQRTLLIFPCPQPAMHVLFFLQYFSVVSEVNSLPRSPFCTYIVVVHPSDHWFLPLVCSWWFLCFSSVVVSHRCAFLVSALICAPELLLLCARIFASYICTGH